VRAAFCCEQGPAWQAMSIAATPPEKQRDASKSRSHRLLLGSEMGGDTDAD